jgi:hypothetical protein
MYGEGDLLSRAVVLGRSMDIGSLQMTQDVFEVMTGSATMVEVNEKYVKSRVFDSRA